MRSWELWFDLYDTQEVPGAWLAPDVGDVGMDMSPSF